MMGVIIKGYGTLVSSYADAEGNFRAINPVHHHGFVGYGRTRDEAKENFVRAVSQQKPASLLAYAQAVFMVLPEADQEKFVGDLAKLRRS